MQLKKYIFQDLSHLLQAGVEGLQILKPQVQMGIQSAFLPEAGIKGTAEVSGGIDVEVRLIISENSFHDEMVHWIVDNVKFSVKQPVMRISSLNCLIIHLLS